MILILTQDWPTWNDSTQSFPKHERTCFLTWNKFIYQHVYINYIENFLWWTWQTASEFDALESSCCAARFSTYEARWNFPPLLHADEAGDTSSKRTSIAEQLDRQLSSKKFHLYLEIIGASSSLSFSFSFSVAVCYDIPKYWGG